MKRPGKFKKNGTTKYTNHHSQEPPECLKYGTCHNEHVDTNFNTNKAKDPNDSVCDCVNKDNNNMKRNALDNIHIFPHWIPWLVLILTLTFRVQYVLQPKNWWVLHPDEIYQTIEVAHVKAYGFGFLPYEFLPPPTEQLGNTTLSDARAHELRLGMYSLRSIILPKLLSLSLLVAQWWGITASPYLVIKVLHAVMTSFLPLAVFYFSTTLYRSLQTGIIASIFTSCSLSLNVFGTHSLTNSFIATFVFFASVPLVKILNKSVSRTYMDNEHHQERQHYLISSENGYVNTSIKEQYVYRKPTDRNSSYKRNNILSKEVSFMEQLSSADGYIDLMSGFVLALCVYIRIDVVTLPVILVFVTMDNIHNNIRKLIQLGLTYTTGFIIGVLIGGYCDVISFGHWFLSPLQWLRFNVLNKTSGFIFGISPSFYYCSKLYDMEPFILVTFGIILFSLPFEIQRRNQTKSKTDTDIKTIGSDYRGTLIVCVLLTLYSGNGHKELRFLHNTIVFIYIASARAIYKLVQTFSNSCENQNNQYCIYSVYIFIALFTSSHIYNFVMLDESGQSKWTYSGNTDSGEVNACLDFIRLRTDVTGVVIDRPLHLAGGYSLIHKDVPIFALNKYEFMEYDDRSKLNILSLRNSYNKNFGFKQVHIFGQISEFISIYNTPYLLKQILTKRHYNYLVLHKDRPWFTENGYKEVYSFGNSRILQRTFNLEDESKMAETAHHIPVGINATILEYEGDWLSYYGLYSKAEQRFLFSNHLDPNRIGPFRALLRMYKRLSVTSSYQSVLQACAQVRDVKDCLKPYQPVKLHADYYRQLIKVDNENG